MSDGKQPQGFDLDLAVMEDEALVVLAEECGYGPARYELIVRYDRQIDRFIAWLAHSYGLMPADLEDAGQNAVFWIVEALTKYDREQIGKVRGCSFRSFVYRVISSRFKDFAKHLRRRKSRYDRSTGGGFEDSSDRDIDRKAKDPAEIAAEKESMTRLRETLDGLDSDSGRLWRMLSEGSSLRQIAGELDVSYDFVKRRRRKLIEQLKIRLSELTTNPDLPASPPQASGSLDGFARPSKRAKPFRSC